MNPTSIKIKPQDNGTCRFTIDGILAPHEVSFSRETAPHGNEMADAILGLPGVTEVRVDGGTVTVLKDSDRDWIHLEEPIAYAIQLGLQPAAGGNPAAAPSIDEDALFDDIAEFFEKEINPGVASHGGKVELIDLQDMKLVVRMMGGCQGCGQANVTLKQGIEGNVKKIWPMIEGIVDVTDHASGTNPYYQPEKK